MRTEHERLEARLREFRPRRPAMIPDERLQLLRGPIWIATAAAIAALMLIAAWLRKPADPRGADFTLGALTTVAVEKPEEFDSELLRLSQTSLPDVTRPGGALERLATFQELSGRSGR